VTRETSEISKTRKTRETFKAGKTSKTGETENLDLLYCFTWTFYISCAFLNFLGVTFTGVRFNTNSASG
jgi:hypothetical protein